VVLKFQEPHDYIAQGNVCIFNAMNVFLLEATQTLNLLLIKPEFFYIHAYYYLTCTLLNMLPNDFPVFVVVCMENLERR
jgi:hypothetical protein